MADRVTEAEVLQIIDVDSSITDQSVGLSPFITSANLLVTQVFSGDTTMSAAMLAEIEKYLSAHFISLRDPRTTEEWNDDIKVKYSGKFGEGLKGTTYGQMVLTLDVTGKMAKLGKIRASLGMMSYSDATT